MRYLLMHRVDESKPEASNPSPEFMAAMGDFMTEIGKTGVLLTAEGVLPSATGAKVRHSAGKTTVTDGPFTEAREVIGGFAIVDVRSREEAVHWASRYAALFTTSRSRSGRSPSSPTCRLAVPTPVGPADLVTTESSARRAVEAVWRIESPRLIGGLMRIVRDLDVAEDLAQEALLAALEQWPGSGVPNSPGAWLMAVAKRRGIDLIRRNERRSRKYDLIAHELEDEVNPMGDVDPIDDDVLRLMFISCHPVLSTGARVALTLRLLGGLTTQEIARAFLVPDATVAQRIVRAKKALSEAGVPFEVPEGPERTARISSVLGVIYLIYNEGYAATAGDDWLRPALCNDAMRLGRVLAALAPREPEVYGLVALMEIQSSRTRARTGPGGEVVLIQQQDRSRWDQLLIRRGLAALTRAEKLGGARGEYALQAAIAACHARARTWAETDWARIASLYEALVAVAWSPVVELNRAVAVTMAHGPEAGLAVVDKIAAEPSLAGYHLLPSVRGDLLERLGRVDEARAEFLRAAELAGNEPERQLLLRRAADAGE